MSKDKVAAQSTIRLLRGKVKFDCVRDFTVLFSAKVHQNAARFVVPVRVRKNFAWTTLNEIGLVIFAESGECRFCGVQTLKSGPEVYGIDMKCLIPGEEIYVLAFQPPP